MSANLLDKFQLCLVGTDKPGGHLPGLFSNKPTQSGGCPPSRNMLKHQSQFALADFVISQLKGRKRFIYVDGLHPVQAAGWQPSATMLKDNLLEFNIKPKVARRSLGGRIPASIRPLLRDIDEPAR